MSRLHLNGDLTSTSRLGGCNGGNASRALPGAWTTTPGWRRLRELPPSSAVVTLPQEAFDLPVIGPLSWVTIKCSPRPGLQIQVPAIMRALMLCLNVGVSQKAAVCLASLLSYRKPRFGRQILATISTMDPGTPRHVEGCWDVHRWPMPISRRKISERSLDVEICLTPQSLHKNPTEEAPCLLPPC